jgi:parvulin-like peptidyl-prolyl isomerase
VEYDRAEVSIIVTEKEDIVVELKRRIDEGEANFRDLARDYSIDESTCRQHGYLGTVYREDLSTAVEAAVFSEGETGIRGPIKDENRFYLVMIQLIKKGELDDEVREIIARTLYDNFLNEMSAKSSVELYILPEVKTTQV